MIATTFYPKGPENLSKDLTKLPSSYKLKASLAILAILLFFILYTALVVVMAYIVYYAFIYDIGRANKITILMKIGAIAGSVMLFIFTLKFIFKIKNYKPENRIKLKKSAHKNLWFFIDHFCEETGAPKPKNIYVDPDVNAYVAYSNTWLSLFLPIKKELTIGLGLTDALNLSEFKAVVTHEFGHFAQKSMKIGSYINSANTIIHDMIYARDKWDDTLDTWRSSDIRLSAAAWIITPIIWLIRQVLALFYKFLNIMYSSLSREMEFNADKVAVSTSGSEAIIAALWKLDAGFEKWNDTISHAYLASKKKVFTKNLYTHNKIALDAIEKEQLEKLTLLPKDNNGNRTFFSSSENSKVNMYASHPPNDLREKNAKFPFIKCLEDNRSPWILFNNTEALQEEMTQLIYKQYVQKEILEFSTVAVFENFITQEKQGKELLEEYENTFLNRFLFIDNEKNLTEKANALTNVTLAGIKTLKKELSTLMQPINDIESLMKKAVEISQGTTKELSFNFKGKDYKKKDIQEGYQLLNTEREKIFNEAFKDWDTKFCMYHLKLANEFGNKESLLKIYNQHNIIIGIYKAIINTKTHIYNEFEKIQQKTDLQQHQIDSFGTQVKDWVVNLNSDLNKIDTKDFIPMSNIDDAKEFKETIIDGGKFIKSVGNIFENGEFNNILNNLENASNQCQRLEQKSIGLILMTHNQLHKKAGA